jgi:hypothetical protein
MNHGIDFDGAAVAWRRNKRSKGQSFAYVCGFIHPNGRRCGIDAVRGTKLCLRNVIVSGEILLCPQHCAFAENRASAENLVKKLTTAQPMSLNQSNPYSESPE